MSAEFAGLTEKTAEQLRVLDQSLWHILLIIVGVLISYGLTADQSRQLLCAAQGSPSGETTNTAPLRLFSSLIIFNALIFFFELSEKTAKTHVELLQQDASNQVNFIASGLVLAAGAFRLWDVLCLQPQISKASAVQVCTADVFNFFRFHAKPKYRMIPR